MRALLPLLLLSVAAPALADPGDNDGREQARARFEERHQAREERAERPQPQQQPRFERPAPQFQRAERVQPPQASFDRPERRFDGDRSADGYNAQRWRDRRAEQPQQQVPPVVVNTAPVRPSGDSVADWRSRDRRGGDRPYATPPRPAVQIEGATYTSRYPGRERDGDRWRDRNRDGRRDGDRWSGRDGRYDRDGDRWRQGNIAWRPDWRRDPRYDWQRYRDRNRAIFRIGAYIDPFGWGYRPVSIGYQLYPNYYADQYWLSDPSYYSLPPVSWPYRWVRYYDDALLIDVRDGRVVDAIQSFFW